MSFDSAGISVTTNYCTIDNQRRYLDVVVLREISETGGLPKVILRRDLFRWSSEQIVIMRCTQYHSKARNARSEWDKEGMKDMESRLTLNPFLFLSMSRTHCNASRESSGPFSSPTTPSWSPIGWRRWRGMQLGRKLS